MFLSLKTLLNLKYSTLVGLYYVYNNPTPAPTRANNNQTRSDSINVSNLSIITRRYYYFSQLAVIRNIKMSCT